MFRVPDAFVVVSVDGVEKFATTTTKKTLNPQWNEHFDVYVAL
jgi:E3 ubiquitin-protein ligase NEDD4